MSRPLPKNAVSSLNDLLLAVRVAINTLPAYGDQDWSSHYDSLRCDAAAARDQLIAATSREKIKKILDDCHQKQRLRHELTELRNLVSAVAVENDKIILRDIHNQNWFDALKCIEDYGQ